MNSDRRKLTTDDLKNSRLLLYRYVRGSHAYGTNIETSDIDIGGVYCADLNRLIGTRLYYDDQVQDSSHDIVYYELEKYIRLLGASNPNILESLFVDDDCIEYMHPAFQILRDNREKFLTKRSFNSFGGYAITQIRKARGLNKKVTMIKPEHKTILDFCYTKYKQGSTNIQNWMNYRFLFQEYVGCVNMPNMGEMIALYYDWKRFITDYPEVDLLQLFELLPEVPENLQAALVSEMKSYKALGEWNDEYEEQFQKSMNDVRMFELVRFICQQYNIRTKAEMSAWIELQKNTDRNYKGMVTVLPDGSLSTCFKMSSVTVDDRPICEMFYNMNGFSEHCKQYREYLEWEKNRNPARYAENCEKNYDSKNMMHAFRLLSMAIEIAEGKGFNCNRKNIDREFLLSIRRHEFSYDELITKLEALKTRFDEACKASQLPDTIDEATMNDLCLQIRFAFWDSNKENV